MRLEFIGKQMNNKKFESNEDGTYNLKFTTPCKTMLGQVMWCVCTIEKLSKDDCAILIKETNNFKTTTIIETEKPKKKGFWKR